MGRPNPILFRSGLCTMSATELNLTHCQDLVHQKHCPITSTPHGVFCFANRFLRLRRVDHVDQMQSLLNLRFLSSTSPFRWVVRKVGEEWAYYSGFKSRWESTSPLLNQQTWGPLCHLFSIHYIIIGWCAGGVFSQMPSTQWGFMLIQLPSCRI